jgi:hypothetical protein
MHTKAPLDVDLEDKLLYGLTPIRLAYLVVALLAGFATWSSPWAPSPLRLVAALILVAVGVAGAWGRWRGRAADAWVADISIFAVKTHRVSWNSRWPKRLLRRPSRTHPALRAAPLLEMVVAGRAAQFGRSQMPNDPVLLLSVASVEAGSVCPEKIAAGES